MFGQTAIPTLGGSSSRAAGIGPQGEVVGFSDDAAGEIRAFYFDANGIRDLGVLPLTIPAAFAGLTVNVSGANAIGRALNGDLMVVGTSGFYPSAGATAAGIPVIPLEQAFMVNVTQPGSFMVGLGTLVPQPLPGLFIGNSQARGINGKGQIVGVTDTTAAGPPRRAFLYDIASGSMADLGTLVRDPATGAFIGNSEAYGINDQGQIVGLSDTGHVDANSGEPIRHAFLYEIATAHMMSIGTLLDAQFGRSAGKGQSEGRAINDSGRVVGISSSLDATHQTEVTRGFLFDPNIIGVRMTRDLGTLDPANRPVYFHDLGNSEAYAINNAGDIVGMAETGTVDASGARIRHAFRVPALTGVMEDLHGLSIINPGHHFTDATGINDAGQICGNVTSANGSTGGLLLTPP